MAKAEINLENQTKQVNNICLGLLSILEADSELHDFLKSCEPQRMSTAQKRNLGKVLDNKDRISDAMLNLFDHLQKVDQFHNPLAETGAGTVA